MPESAPGSLPIKVFVRLDSFDKGEERFKTVAVDAADVQPQDHFLQ